MMRRIAVCLVSRVLTTPVWAEDKGKEYKESPPATGGSGTSTDMSKMGSWTRKPTNESKTRKEIEAFVKEGDAIMKRRDFQADVARADFPIYMATDDSKGVPMAETYDRQKYTEMMQPMFEQTPADVQVKHDLDITVLSDSLVSFTDEYTMTTGGKKYDGRNAGLLVKRDGQWKWKAFFEAGWGNMPSTGVGGSGTPMDQDHDKPKK
jgi:SnoaL-like domain